MPRSLLYPAVALSVAAATGAAAQSNTGVGYVGVVLSYSDVVEDRTPDSNVQSFPMAIEGNYAFPIFGNGMLGASIYYGMTSWDTTQPNFDFDFPDQELRLALSYSHAITSDLRVGAFGAFSRSGTAGSDLQREPYDTIYGGVQAQYFLSDVMLFGQLGAGSALAFPPDQPAGDPEGFEDGSFLRAGMTWFPVDNTAITFDYEQASSGAFLDGGTDTGDFTSFGLSGETMLPTDLPLAATYFVRHDMFEINSGDITATDLTFGIGLRMVFGGSTPEETWRNGRQLTAPRMPARAVDWLETLD